MCLYTDQLEPIVAEEDIIVYKVIDDTNLPTKMIHLPFTCQC